MLTIYCDGGSRNNPGHAAYGFVVKANSTVVKTEGGYIGIATNNIAEYTAVVKALSWLEKDFKGQDLEFYLDSNLVVSQLNGIFKVKNAELRNYIVKIRTLIPRFKTVSFSFIPREQNKEADKMVNIALDKHLYGS